MKVQISLCINKIPIISNKPSDGSQSFGCDAGCEGCAICCAKCHTVSVHPHFCVYTCAGASVCVCQFLCGSLCLEVLCDSMLKCVCMYANIFTDVGL